MTANLDFKITPLFDAVTMEYFTTSDILKGCHFKRPRVILSDLE